MKINSIETFISLAKLAHGDKYDYSETVYINSKTKIIYKCPIHGYISQNSSSHVHKKTGCPKCTFDNKLNIGENLIKKSNLFFKELEEKYPNTYNTNNSIFLGLRKNIILGCKKHGEFITQPSLIIKDNKICPKCAQEKAWLNSRMSQNEFIEKAVLKHGNKYDYTKTIYVKSNEKVIINCNYHKEIDLFVTPNEHLQGAGGCRKCSDLRNSNVGINLLNKQKDFLEKCKSIHKDRYDLTELNFKAIKNNVKVKCYKHGYFYPQAYDFVRGSNCPKCSQIEGGLSIRSNTQEFIKKAIGVHGDTFNYTKVNYVKSNEKVEIICKYHGSFYQRPNRHLMGDRCPSCTTGYSRTNFIKKVESTKSKTGTLYLCYVTYKDEKFLKIGITSNTVKKRFSDEKLYHFHDVITITHFDAAKIFDAEKYILKTYKPHKYIPNIFFKGHTECIIYNKDTFSDLFQLMLYLADNNMNVPV